MLSISCFSLNVRGILNLIKRKYVFSFCKSFNQDVFSCKKLKSTSCEEDEKFWQNLANINLFCHGTRRAGGVAVFLVKN